MPVKFPPLTVIHWVYKVVNVVLTYLWQNFVDLSVQCEEGIAVFISAKQVQAPGAGVVCRSGVVFGVPSDFSCTTTGTLPDVNVISHHCNLKGPEQIPRSSPSINVKTARQPPEFLPFRKQAIMIRMRDARVVKAAGQAGRRREEGQRTGKTKVDQYSTVRTEQR